MRRDVLVQTVADARWKPTWAVRRASGPRRERVQLVRHRSEGAQVRKPTSIAISYIKTSCSDGQHSDRVTAVVLQGAQRVASLRVRPTASALAEPGDRARYFVPEDPDNLLTADPDRRSSVSFRSGDVSLAGHLYRPSGVGERARTPAVALCGPISSVKEHLIANRPPSTRPCRGARSRTACGTRGRGRPTRVVRAALTTPEPTWPMRARRLSCSS